MTSDWSRLLHCVPDHKYDLESLNQFFYKRATMVSKWLGLDQSKGKDIAEIGCGLGHLSKTLSEYHNVSSFDDLDFMADTIIYQKYHKEFNWPRKNFYFKTPHLLNEEHNIKNFANINNDNKNFDYILWQNSSLLDEKTLTENCLKILLENLIKKLKENGKLLIGFDTKNDPPCGQKPFFSFLKKYMVSEDEDNLLFFGRLVISVDQKNYP